MASMCGELGCARDWPCPVHTPTEAPARPASELSPPLPAPATIDQGKARQNAGKPPLHLVPYDAVVMVSWVLAFGAEKYKARGWEEGGLSWTDCARAIASHLAKLLCGQWLDDESGCPHAAHIAGNAMFLCAMSARGIGRRDLVGVNAEPGGPHTPWDIWAPTPEQLAAVAKIRAAKGTTRG